MNTRARKKISSTQTGGNRCQVSGTEKRIGSTPTSSIGEENLSKAHSVPHEVLFRRT